MEITMLQSKKEVLTYLEGRGYKLKKSALYRHLSEGRLRPGAGGVFTVKDVDRYAKLFLRRLDGAAAASRTLEAMQERRLRAETAKLESQARHWEIRARMAAGEIIDKGQVELELAARAMIFKVGLENFSQMQAPEIIGLCGGDPSKTEALITFINEAAAEWLHEYSKPWQWKIVMEPDPDDPDMLLASVTKARADRHEPDDDEMEND
jgi:hypothetical protein